MENVQVMTCVSYCLRERKREKEIIKVEYIAARRRKYDHGALDRYEAGLFVVVKQSAAYSSSMKNELIVIGLDTECRIPLAANKCYWKTGCLASIQSIVHSSGLDQQGVHIPIRCLCP